MAATGPAQFHSDEKPTPLLSASTLVGPATVFVAAGLVLPLAILLRYSFNSFEPRRMMVETFTLDNYVKFFADPYYTGVLWTTLRVAALCTVACLIMGFPLAYMLARTQSRYKNVLIMLVVLPLFVGNAVRAAGWMTLFGSKGFLNVTLMQFGAITQPLQIMYTEGAVVAGIIAVNLPYMVLTLQSVIEGINRNLEEAAFSLGAGPTTMFRRVLLPLALPGLLAGTILTFILGMNAYATPVLLGGPKFKMMGPLVYGQFQLNNWPFGAAVAFILMTTTLLLTAAAGYWMQQRYRR
jgi:putative spermidine/putrescine transport system permease protein